MERWDEMLKGIPMEWGPCIVLSRNGVHCVTEDSEMFKEIKGNLEEIFQGDVKFEGWGGAISPHGRMVGSISVYKYRD